MCVEQSTIGPMDRRANGALPAFGPFLTLRDLSDRAKDRQPSDKRLYAPMGDGLGLTQAAEVQVVYRVTSLMVAGMPLTAARSPHRRKTCVKSLCWGFKPQVLTGPLVELACHSVQVSLRVDRQVSSFRKVLSQQTIGVLIGTALPRTLRIAEVNIDIGR